MKLPTEQMASPRVVVQELDVLCGSEYKDHPGNRRFLTILKEYSKLYARAANKSSQRRILVDKVVRCVRPGRFLTWDSQGWNELGENRVRDKIGHGLRECGRERRRRPSPPAMPPPPSPAVWMIQTKKANALLERQQAIFRALVQQDQKLHPVSDKSAADQQQQQPQDRLV